MSYIKERDIELVRTQAQELEKLGDYHIWRIYNLGSTPTLESSPLYGDYKLIGNSEEGGFLIATIGYPRLTTMWIVEGWKSTCMDGIKRRIKTDDA